MTHHLHRRRWLKTSLGGLGLSLSSWIGLQRSMAQSAVATSSLLPGSVAHRSSHRERSAEPKAKSCIILFCWGGISHIDTWDMKPDAGAEVRGIFRPASTRVSGIQITEHMPHLAGQTDKLAIVRSVHHTAAAHGKGMYWNMTGHAPDNPGVAANVPPAPDDWPSLGAMVSKFREAPRGFPPAVRLSYPLVDNGSLQAGEYAGWLGKKYDPIVVRAPGGTPFGGVSRSLGAAELVLEDQVDLQRLDDRVQLLQSLGQLGNQLNVPNEGEYYRQMALDMLANPEVKRAFDIDSEPEAIRNGYGDHSCGRSILLSRRLAEAGVPITTVCCAAADLNGSVGDHWDTHGDNFNRLKNAMLPAFDRPAAFLLEDLKQRGMLDETLVVFLTEFGRTPQINAAAGRDHFPNCYSVAFAGGGIEGGQVYGKSDKVGAAPAEDACTPADLHATIFRSLGIALDSTLHDHLGRPFPITDGTPLFA